jgi:hypothetical protein
MLHRSTINSHQSRQGVLIVACHGLRDAGFKLLSPRRSVKKLAYPLCNCNVEDALEAATKRCTNAMARLALSCSLLCLWAIAASADTAPHQLQAQEQSGVRRLLGSNHKFKHGDEGAPWRAWGGLRSLPCYHCAQGSALTRVLDRAWRHVLLCLGLAHVSLVCLEIW